MKAFLVARVSIDDQKDALPAQAFRLTEYAKRRGYEYELTEIRESAYKGNRSAFSELVKKITLHNDIAVVVFDKIDRYTRDSSSQEVRILDDLRKSGKIELHFPSDNLFIHRDSPATDLLRLGMGVVVAQYFLMQLAITYAADSNRSCVMVNGSAWRHLAIRILSYQMERSGLKLIRTLLKL